MSHPSFDIFHQLAELEFNDSNVQLLQALKEQVCDMPVWIAGRQVPAPNQQTATRLHLSDETAGSRPVLPLYVNRDDALAQCGAHGFFAGTIQMAIGFAEGARIDADLRAGGEVIRFSHDKLLEIRDMVSLGQQGIPMSANEVLLQREAIMTFAAHARHYCAAHRQVESLHLATLTTPGIKSMLVGSLDAAAYDTHAAALTSLSREMFLPAWRFVLLDDGNDRLALMNALRQMRPCYEKKESRGWWNRIKGMFKTPKVAAIELTLTR